MHSWSALENSCRQRLTIWRKKMRWLVGRLRLLVLLWAMWLGPEQAWDPRR